MRVHPTKTDTAQPVSGPAYYQPKLGRRSFAPEWWPSWLLLALLRLVALLPLRASRVLGAALGLLIYALNAKRRHIARVNLGLCFPEKSERTHARLLRRHFMVKGQSYVDLGFLTWASERRVRHHTQFRGLEQLRAAQERGKNVILLAPHCLGMNFAASALACQCAEFSMMKIQRNPVVNWLLNKSRMRFGLKLVARTQGLRPVVRALKEGLAFYYLPDEDFGPRHSVFVPFFGVPTATLTTLGRLADLTNAVVIPCFVRLLSRGRGYEVTLKPALADFPKRETQADAACMNHALEDGIRASPEQYMWTFKLFKTRPHGTPPPY